MSKYMNMWKFPTSYKATFMEPTGDNINNISIGDSVKISNGSELFWVYVKEIEDDIVAGIIDNKLKIKQNYNHGDMIFLKKNHIHDILTCQKKNSLRSKYNNIP